MSLQRRSLLKTLEAGGLLALASPREQRAQQQVASATKAMPIPKIKDISVIECQPEACASRWSRSLPIRMASTAMAAPPSRNAPTW